MWMRNTRYTMLYNVCEQHGYSVLQHILYSCLIKCIRPYAHFAVHNSSPRTITVLSVISHPLWGYWWFYSVTKSNCNIGIEFQNGVSEMYLRSSSNRRLAWRAEEFCVIDSRCCCCISFLSGHICSAADVVTRVIDVRLQFPERASTQCPAER